MASFAGEQGFLVRSRPHLSRRAAFLWGGAVLLWAAGVAFGMNALVEHEVGAGTPAGAPERWPASSAIPADLGRPTLVMLAHPQCPCTRASISQLAILMARIKGLVSAHVLFVRPEGTPDAWERTSLWTSAARIPGVTVHADPNGRAAAVFGAFTSGQVLLYSPRRTLLFAGGITPGRGHMGDNVGLTRVVSLVRSGAVDRSASSVFGCPLFEEGP